MPIEETIASLSFSDEDSEEDVSDVDNLNEKQASFRTWVPAQLPPYVNHRIAHREIYRPGTAAHEPKRSIKIPVEINIFGEKVYGIIDSGSGRSILSESAYNRVKQFQIQELTIDLTSRAGVRLGDKSIVKGLGGAGFVIDIADVYGPQWFSVMPKLSGDLILGMDFWLNFKVLVDPFSQNWTLSGSKHHYPLSHSSTVLNELQTLSVDETER